MQEAQIMESQDNGAYFEEDFCSVNEQFWSQFEEPDSAELLLVETSDNPIINHSNAVLARIIAAAKSWKIAWIKFPHTEQKFMRSYSPRSNFIDIPRIPLMKKIIFLGKAIYYYLSYVFFVNRLNKFTLNNILYGDFVYDGYLSHYSMATLHRLDFRIIKIFCILMVRDEEARIMLNKNNIQGVLTAHYIGLATGPLSRVAMQKGKFVYWKGGGHAVFRLNLFRDLNEIYDHPVRPKREYMDVLYERYKKQAEEDFQELIKNVNKPFSVAFSGGYGENIFTEETKEQFAEHMGLDPLKPFVFVMLHCFNDHPLSHFNQMVFNDYFDWFYQTLQFARKDKTKNWVFKEHPANIYYPTVDIDMHKIMSKLPSHVKYADTESKITPSTVLNVADIIITCLGSAGIEMPSLKGIPAITAGEAMFTGFGFTIEPKTKNEYFELLRNLKPELLNEKQQMMAKCCYVYMQKYALLPLHAAPPVTFQESREIERLKDIYKQRIVKTYREKENVIKQQFKDYRDKIAETNFRRLHTIDFENHQHEESVNGPM